MHPVNRKACWFLLLGLSISGICTACPLEGLWDTGFITTAGHQFSRMELSFDCQGKAALKVTFLNGRLLTGAGEVYETRATYQIAEDLPAGAKGIDLTISAHNVRYLDLESVKSRNGTTDGCWAGRAEVLKPMSLLGMRCGDTRYPSLGDIQRAAFLVEANTLYWSPLTGDSIPVVQRPGETVRRLPVVDRNRPFKKL